MAVFQSIRNFFTNLETAQPEVVVPAPPTTYSLHPLTLREIDTVLRLNNRCFRNGENYTRHTFSYLLNEPATVSYQAVTAEGSMAGFAFVMMNPDGAGHLTTIGVAPEHRRRGLGLTLLQHLENSLRKKGASTIVLEVRVSNMAAQKLYNSAGYAVVQRLTSYYSNGEDGYLMVKALS
ncbi:MAG TPA: ribosomal protein S18-alanine N-acetyltransferase [Pyrinomonadaceae bacterium]|nr:ribosomal protein S18-alanine N-acetyltransferase [Pyrinomonadaceae bacterium]